MNLLIICKDIRIATTANWDEVDQLQRLEVRTLVTRRPLYMACFNFRDWWVWEGGRGERAVCLPAESHDCYGMYLIPKVRESYPIFLFPSFQKWFHQGLVTVFCSLANQVLQNKPLSGTWWVVEAVQVLAALFSGSPGDRAFHPGQGELSRS